MTRALAASCVLLGVGHVLSCASGSETRETTDESLDVPEGGIVAPDGVSTGETWSPEGASDPFPFGEPSLGDSNLGDAPEAEGEIGDGPKEAEVPTEDSGPLPHCTADMCLVPPGTFFMGCNSGDGKCPSNSLDNNCLPSEHPCHVVHVPEFWIDRTEVTVAAYGMCVDAGSCEIPDTSLPHCNWKDRVGKADHPINCVGWAWAGGYCAFVGKRLCSEAEWERAARGDDGRLFPWGNDEPLEATGRLGQPVANLADETGRKSNPSWGDAYLKGYDDGFADTAPVGSFPLGASPFGPLDMSGNVQEWVEDRYSGDFVGAPNDGAAWELSGSADRVVKGGAFLASGAVAFRGSARWHFFESSDGAAEGLRCCK